MHFEILLSSIHGALGDLVIDFMVAAQLLDVLDDTAHLRLQLHSFDRPHCEASQIELRKCL